MVRGNEAEPGTTTGDAGLYSIPCWKCKYCTETKYLRTWTTYRSIRDLLMARTSVSRVAPKRVRPVRRLHGCVVVMGWGSVKSSPGETARASSWACSCTHCSVCACRCGPMQVRQCEATVDLTGRDQGHVHSSEPMASHRIESNRR